MFNAGYLTIKKEISQQVYVLKFPNNETEQVMINYFLKLTFRNNFEIISWKKISKKIMDGIFRIDKEKIKDGTESLIYEISANIPYDWINKNPEGWLKTMLGIAIKMNDVYYIGENQNIIGRTDLHIPKNNCVYVLELKVNEKAITCIKQINEKYEPAYKNQFERIVKIGVNWDRKNKQVDVMVESI